MKKIQLFACAFATALFTLSFTACDEDDPVVPDPDPTPTPTPEPDPDPVPDEQTYHFDLFLTVGRQGGMGRDVTTIVKSTDALTSDQEMINLENDGVEINADYTMEAIYKGAYYYQVPVAADRFVKFQIKDNAVNVIQAQPFQTNTYNIRQYTHAWIDDNTLIIMAADGEAKHIQWTKLNTQDMRILDEGTLALEVPMQDEGYTVFSTSGIVAYRKSDAKLFYFYFGKTKSGRGGESTPYFYTAIINPETMEIESNQANTLAQEMAGSAYGELLQNTVMFDENDNLYLAAFSDTDIEEGHLLRINAGATDFDPNYEGFRNPDGKLLTIHYLGDGKALIYSRNDASGTDIDSYSHYYSILDLETGERTRLTYEGEEIPYSSGRFSQRTAIVDGKVYIGVNTETSNPCVYIYDIETGNVEKGVEIAEGYYFEQIRVMENE